MIGIALKLLGVGKWVKKVAGDVFAWIGKHPREFAIIALVAVSALLWRGESVALNERDLARAETKAQAASYRAAQVAAAAKQAAQDRTEFTEKNQLAEQIDDLSKQSQTAARDAVAVYARANPVRLRCKAADSAGGTASAPGVSGDPQKPADSDPAAEMVAITRADLDTLSDAALQKTVSTLYLTALIEAGWAVPSE